MQGVFPQNLLKDSPLIVYLGFRFKFPLLVSSGDYHRLKVFLITGFVPLNFGFGLFGA